MSNQIFPDLASLGIGIERTPLYAVANQVVDSGKRLSVVRSTRPRYRYALEFSGLRRVFTIDEFATFTTFLAGHRGGYESFLFRDPEDCQVVNHGFGMGDGVTTVFQLQRTLGGVSSDRAGTWPIVSVPRTNLATQSTITSWANNAGTTVQANCEVAPDGTLTAGQILDDTSGSHSRFVSAATSVGVTYTASAILRAGSVTRARLRTPQNTHLADFDLAAGTVLATTAATATISAAGAGGWFLCTVTFTPATVPATGMVLIDLLNPTASYTGTGTGFIRVWRSQVERGTVATRIVPTAGAAVTAAPAYWPAAGDGFEPVDQPDWATVAVSVSGIPLAAGSLWSPQPAGVVSFLSAPDPGVPLTWTGTYHRRCRITSTDVTFRRVASGVWAVGGLELESVI